MSAYEADGIVTNVALHTIKVQNWDNTITVVPTHKLLDTPYRNWRGLTESGGRRIKRALHVDLTSIAFCDSEMIERFRSIGLIQDYVEQRIADVVARGGRDDACTRDVCAEHELTNVGVFRAYISAYLKSRADVHQEGDMAFLIRQLDPGPMGLPRGLRFYQDNGVGLKEAIQAEIFEHLVVAAPAFGLRVFPAAYGHGLPRGSGSGCLTKPTKCRAGLGRAARAVLGSFRFVVYTRLSSLGGRRQHEPV